MSRNQISKITGLDEIGGNLEQLWLSYNEIDSLSGLAACKALQKFFIGHNMIKDWAEVERLKENESLTTVVLKGNEIYEKAQGDVNGRYSVLKRVPHLTMIDGMMVKEEDRLKSEDPGTL